MKNCPHCGEELADDTIYCGFCNRSLVDAPGRPLDEGPSPILTLLMTAVILLLLFLLALGLYQIKPLFAALFALFASLLLAFLGTRGRYLSPGLRQYLLTFLISLIPLVGTMYVTVFAARYAASSRPLRIALGVTVLLSAGLVVLLNFNLDVVQEALASLQRTPTPTLTAAPTRTPSRKKATPTPLPNLTTTGTITPQPTDTRSPVIPVGDCMLWSQVTLDHLDLKTCVTGDYIRYYQKGDGSWVLAFSDDPGTFQVWSAAKRPMELLVPRDGSTCVVASGWILTSGVRPIIIVGTKGGTLEPCP